MNNIKNICIIISLESHLLYQILREPSDPIRDIDDTSHYSIEDAKRKAEHDRMMKAADAKKQHVSQQAIPIITINNRIISNATYNAIQWNPFTVDTIGTA